MDQDPLQELRLLGRDAAILPATGIGGETRLRYVLRQTFRYDYSAPVSSLEQWLMVIPPLRHGPQHRASHRLTIVGTDGSTAWFDDAFANFVAHISVPRIARSLEFEVEATIDRIGDSAVPVAETALAEHLAATPLTAANRAMEQAARDAVASATNQLEMAERISQLVNATVRYQKGVTSVETTAAEAFTLRAGVCQDHAHVMLGMCRALGIPARYVSGHLLGEGATHAWVEVLLPDPHTATGAIAAAFDPCHGRRADATYVTVAVGRDYRDVAPTSGHYHGRSSNHLTSVTHLKVSPLP